MSDADIERLAADFIAEDWEPDRYYRDMNVVAFARALLAAPPAAQAGDAWISVEDRLPEPDSGEVLVWLTGGRCAFDEWHMHHEDPIGMGGPTMEMGCMWRDYDFEEVTHWQPLPAAPRAALKGQPEGGAA
jgi:hypothetical protein